MDAVARFAAEATEFRDWARGGTDVGADAARNALLRLTRLYLAALGLPSRWFEAGDGPDAERVDDDEWQAVYTAAGRLPLDYYGDVHDPLLIPPDTASIGSVSDDIADTYRDVVTGLREYEAGRHASALWEWGFGFQCHWGRHATGAIVALHCWLAKNDEDLLTSGD